MQEGRPRHRHCRRLPLRRHPPLDRRSPADSEQSDAASQSSPARSVTPDVDDVDPLPLQPPIITEEMLSKDTPNDVNVIAQMLKLTNKHHASAEFPSIRPRNVKKCLAAPLHFLGGYRSWDRVIAALYHWNRMLSKEEQVEETKKGRKMSSSQAHTFRENRKFLVSNRPPPIPQDISPLVPERVSVRVRARERIDELDRLVNNESIRTQDPEVQSRARERSGAGAEEASDSIVPPVGLHSSAEQREDLVRSREENRVRFKVRRTGENATSIAQQADSVAMNAMCRLMRVYGETVDTLHYPGRTPGQPTHKVVMMTYRTVEVSNKSGGRLTSRRTEKPILTVYGRNEDVVDNFFTGICDQIQSRDDGTESPVDYNFVPMQSESMRSTLEERNNENVSARSKGSRISLTSGSIQENMESQGRVHGMMSPALD